MFRLPAALVALAVLTVTAAAQPPAATVPPPFSPYLNLLRQGGSPALNYYGLVRPEQNLRQQLQGVQSVAATNQQNIGNLASGELAATGVPAQFLNHYRYFLTQRSGAVGGTGYGGSNAGLYGGANNYSYSSQIRQPQPPQMPGSGGGFGAIPAPRRR